MPPDPSRFDPPPGDRMAAITIDPAPERVARAVARRVARAVARRGPAAAAGREPGGGHGD